MIYAKPEHGMEHQAAWISIDQENLALEGTHTKEGYSELNFSDSSPLKDENEDDDD